MELYFEHIAKMGFDDELRSVLGMARHSAEDVLLTVKVPTLVIAGEKDGMCPKHLVERIYEGIEGAELFVVPDGTVKNNLYVEASSGYPEMDNLAMKALRAFKFAPIAGGEEQEGGIIFYFRLSR